MDEQTYPHDTWQAVAVEFGHTAKPDLRGIEHLGCCKEHAADFEWYRQHTWEEFAHALPSGRFDPFDFNSLHPLAYHYFVHGVAVGLAAAINTDAGENALSWADDWVRVFVPLKQNTEDFRRDYLPLFSTAEREAVARVLELYNAWHERRNGYIDADIDRAVSSLWRAET